MKKLILFIFISLLSISNVEAQEQRKYWSDGELEYSDFQLTYSDTISIHFSYYLAHEKGKKKINDTIIIFQEALCFMDKNKSSLDTNYNKYFLLQYYQTVFDILELNKRRFQKKIYNTHPFHINSDFYNTFDQFETEVFAFQQDTYSGLDTNKLAIWQQYIYKELQKEGEDKIPSFSKQNFGIGMHAGFGYSTLTGLLGDHFNSSYNFNFGFDFAYKDIILYTHATFGIGSVKKDYNHEYLWEEGKQANLAILDLSLGYAFLNTSKIKLSPFAGYGLSELSKPIGQLESDDNDEKLAQRYVSSNLIFGLNFDYKIAKKLKLSPATEFVETNIRARLYITKANFYDDLNGYTINLTIGIGGFANFIKILEY